MRVFTREYSGIDVFIKIRVELVSRENANGGDFIFVMFFHFAQWEFKKSYFPYRNS